MVEKLITPMPEKETGRTVAQKRTRALALALARANKNRRKLGIEEYVRIVDEARATDPAFDGDEIRLISIDKNPSARYSAKTYLRSIPRALEENSEDVCQEDDREFALKVFREIQGMYPKKIKPEDLYAIFGVDKFTPPVTTDFNKSVDIPYTPSAPIEPGMGNREIDIVSFLSHLREAGEELSRPDFMAHPTPGYIDTRFDRPLADWNTPISRKGFR